MKTRCVIFLLGIFLIGMEAGYAQFSQNSSRSLFSDVKAFKEGDAIMVFIVEDTQADNTATTTEGRSTDLSAGFDVGLGGKGSSGSLGLKSGNNHTAKGQTTRKETIKSRLSARVVGVNEETGNLEIQGTRTTTINGEKQTIVINGFVRPVDVRPDNSIFSYSILDLSLSITGDGNVTKVQEPGLITKFLRILF